MWATEKWESDKLKHLAHLLHFPILFHQFNGCIKGKCIWMPVLLDPTLKTFLIKGFCQSREPITNKCDYSHLSLQLHFRHQSSYASTWYSCLVVNCLLYKMEMHCSLCLHADLFLSSCIPIPPPIPIDHFPLHYLSPSFLCRCAPNMVQTGIWVTLSSFSLHSPVCVKLVQSLSRVWAWENK